MAASVATSEHTMEASWAFPEAKNVPSWTASSGSRTTPPSWQLLHSTPLAQQSLSANSGFWNSECGTAALAQQSFQQRPRANSGPALPVLPKPSCSSFRAFRASRASMRLRAHSEFPAVAEVAWAPAIPAQLDFSDTSRIGLTSAAGLGGSRPNQASSGSSVSGALDKQGTRQTNSAPEMAVKYIFLVRHAQSRWNVVMNAIKRPWDISTLATSLTKAIDNDHGLSDAGAAEAEELRERIGAELAGTGDAADSAKRSSQEKRFYAAFRRARECPVLCSPMRRAVQTASRALPSEDGWRSLRLVREAKELRNHAWEYDCGSSADNVGNNIAFNAELGDDSGRVDAQECECQWWNDSADTSDEQEQQLLALWQRIASTPGSSSSVVVTHSNLIRRLSGLLADKFVDANLSLEADKSEFPSQLASARVSKLRNCGVLGLRFQLVGTDWIVEDVQLLFSSDFEAQSHLQAMEVVDQLEAVLLKQQSPSTAQPTEMGGRPAERTDLIDLNTDGAVVPQATPEQALSTAQLVEKEEVDWLVV